MVHPNLIARLVVTTLKPLEALAAPLEILPLVKALAVETLRQPLLATLATQLH